jgi:hypothetical protein
MPHFWLAVIKYRIRCLFISRVMLSCQLSRVGARKPQGVRQALSKELTEELPGSLALHKTYRR